MISLPGGHGSCPAINDHMTKILGMDYGDILRCFLSASWL